ncbi:MAG TPA: hypothetical protein VG095_08835, partial [Chthoniobacterales bacterium]|nr:hypothetical protein [Chthoniobacterales bacterium]
LALGGIVLLLVRQWRQPWTRFLLYGLVAATIPAALTINNFPQLRLAAVPVFLHVLAIPAAAELTRAGAWRRRVLFGFAVAVLLAQGAAFQRQFHVRSPARWHVFDARFPRKILEPALAVSGSDPIYLYDPPGRSGYIHALWHGAVRGIDASRFRRLPVEAAPPPGAVVISTEHSCTSCRLLVRALNAILYAAMPTQLAPTVPLVACENMRAEVAAPDLPETFVSGEVRSVEVTVRNSGIAAWSAVADENWRGEVRLHARWRAADGALAAEAPPVGLTYEMEPGDSEKLRLDLGAPDTPGDYIVEFAIVQEGADCADAAERTSLRRKVKVVPSALQVIQ